LRGGSGAAGDGPHVDKVPNGCMTKREFKEGLLRLAHARLSHVPNIAEKIVVMIEQHIIPGCQGALNPIVDDDDSVRLRPQTAFQRSGSGF